jgi:hypothetical protein
MAADQPAAADRAALTAGRFAIRSRWVRTFGKRAISTPSPSSQPEIVKR